MNGKTKVVEAFAAIDSSGKWIVYGFEEMKTIAHLHETGVTEDLEEPMAFYRIRAVLEIPEISEAPLIAGGVERVCEPQEE